MGKTRDLKKIRDTKGIFHVKMGTIKDKNCMALTEAEDIKKRQQEYTEELYQKDLHDPDNHDGVTTHPQPDILECKVKWALGSVTTNKASGGDGIPVELFQILKDDSVTVLYSICQKVWKTAVATGLEKVSFHSSTKEGQSQRMLKLPHNCIHLKYFPSGSEGRASACSVGDLGSMPGLGRSPGEGSGNPLQYSCLENPMDRGAWWTRVMGSQRVRHD